MWHPTQATKRFVEYEVLHIPLFKFQKSDVNFEKLQEKDCFLTQFATGSFYFNADFIGVGGKNKNRNTSEQVNFRAYFLYTSLAVPWNILLNNTHILTKIQIVINLILIILFDKKCLHQSHCHLHQEQQNHCQKLKKLNQFWQQIQNQSPFFQKLKRLNNHKKSKLNLFHLLL